VVHEQVSLLNNYKIIMSEACYYYFSHENVSLKVLKKSASHYFPRREQVEQYHYPALSSPRENCAYPFDNASPHVEN